MPCFKTAFLLNHAIFGELHMDGNTIFALTEPTAKEVRQLAACKPAELVMTMGPITQLRTAEEINTRIAQLRRWMSGREND